ncbi:Flp pilus assembly protein CpaB [Arthrobacter monumenti]
MFRRTSTSRRPRRTSTGQPSGAVPRWIIRNRRLLAALLFCCAAGLAVHQLTPADAARVKVVVAGSDLAAGQVLRPSALTLADVPPGIAPGSAYSSVEQLIGKQLGAPVRSGEILTDAALLGPGLLIGAPPGTVAVPLRVTDPGTVKLVRPGERVNVVVSTGNGYERAIESEVAAEDVVVLWTSAAGSAAQSSSTGGGGGWLGTSEAEGLVVIAAAPGQAKSLAGASARGKVSLVMVGPTGTG